ncbi:sulfur carrier protein ThiS [Psychromonas sp. MME2]|uniref:sulfur carrier protein ThiS n=1 Tax=unclassified Psychromonas TaxID=2614957 RepID=UPI00339C535E
MKIFVNEQPIEVAENCNINALLTLLEKPLNGSAVAVNQRVISRGSWSQFGLNEGDQISLFQAIAGG